VIFATPGYKSGTKFTEFGIIVNSWHRAVCGWKFALSWRWPVLQTWRYLESASLRRSC